MLCKVLSTLWNMTIANIFLHLASLIPTLIFGNQVQNLREGSSSGSEDKYKETNQKDIQN